MSLIVFNLANSSLPGDTGGYYHNNYIQLNVKKGEHHHPPPPPAHLNSNILHKTAFLQRQGCIHGEEMDYIFGIPLNYKLSKNYTRQEEHLSEMVLTYWSNFITSG